MLENGVLCFQHRKYALAGLELNQGTPFVSMLAPDDRSISLGNILFVINDTDILAFCIPFQYVHISHLIVLQFPSMF